MSFDFLDRKFVPRPLVAPEPKVCSNCGGSGWEHYGLGWGDPHSRECTECGNPEGLPSP